ncbi:glycosyltransferase [Salmonella bongori]|nr:glycosyltransferase [Salmonella bongori]
MKAMLDKADVFLLPSITGADGDMEGIPVALMEAMAVGAPPWYLLCIVVFRNW